MEVLKCINLSQLFLRCKKNLKTMQQFFWLRGEADTCTISCAKRNNIGHEQMNPQNDIFFFVETIIKLFNKSEKKLKYQSCAFIFLSVGKKPKIEKDKSVGPKQTKFTPYFIQAEGLLWSHSWLLELNLDSQIYFYTARKKKKTKILRTIYCNLL